MPKDNRDKTDAGSLAFTTTLSNLISQGSNTSNPRARTKPKPTNKDDIFARHNRGAQKRAADDIASADTGNANEGGTGTGRGTEAEIQRSKRRMEEKTRIYNDLKSGRHLADSDDDDDDDDDDIDTGGYHGRLRRKEREGLVDFDRKFFDSHQDDPHDEDEDNASVISYEDELGRTRHGTRAEAEAARAEATQAQEQEQAERGKRWQPARPSTLIYGPTVQTAAFNPDADISTRMTDLAARRDRSATPPSETHYDAEGEVRNRGTGFYAFAHDEATRRVQMEELGRVREETMREREGQRDRRAVRENVKMERRKAVEELRGRRRAEVFLTSLDLAY